MVATPTVFDGALPVARKQTSTLVACPKCKTDLDISKIADDSLIECTCGNVFVRPKLPWYGKLPNFLISLLGSFLLGLASNFAYDALKSQGPWPWQTTQEQGNVFQNK